MRWLRNRGMEILIVCAVVLILAGAGYWVWFRWTHTCTAWEPVATCRKCVAWSTYTTVDGKGQIHSHQRCSRYEACKCCTQWEEDKNVPEKPIPPPDACP